MRKKRILSEEHKRKIGLSNRGKKKPPVSDETRKKLSIISKNSGIGKRNLGKKRTIETRIKMSNSSRKGELSRFWKGGVTSSIYSTNWTKTLKISIRERDKYICQICGEKQGDFTHSVHHINYIKTDCNPDNLITLCRRCHAKTTYGDRNYWIKYFKILLITKRYAEV